MAIILVATVLVIEVAEAGIEPHMDKPDLAKITIIMLIAVLGVFALVLGFVAIVELCECIAGVSCRRSAKLPASSSTPSTTTPSSTPTTAAA